MELTLASLLGTCGSPRAGIRTPERSASPRSPNPEPGGAGDRRSCGRASRRPSTPFFLTPDQADDPSAGVSQNAALEPGSGAEAGEAVQLAETSLGFHGNQDPSPLTPNVSSSQRAFTVDKRLKSTHTKRRRPLFSFCLPSQAVAHLPVEDPGLFSAREGIGSGSMISTAVATSLPSLRR